MRNLVRVSDEALYKSDNQKNGRADGLAMLGFRTAAVPSRKNLSVASRLAGIGRADEKQEDTRARTYLNLHLDGQMEEERAK